MQHLILAKTKDICAFISVLLVSILLPQTGIAQNTIYLDQDFSSGKQPRDWVLDSAGHEVAAGTCRDHKNIFSFDCQSLPPTHAPKPTGFSGNIATIDLKNVGGATKAADSQYCVVTDTVDTRGSANLKLTFDWQHSVPRSFGYYAIKGAFQVQVWDGNQWQEVFAREDDGSGRAERFISQYSNSDLRIRFCFNTEGGYSHSNMTVNGAAFDNVRLTDVTCPPPANAAITQVKSRTAKVRWQSRNTNTQQSFLVSAKGPNVHTQIAQGQQTTIKGLKAGKTYQTAIREVCKNGDTSLAVQGPEFTTWCDPKPAPYFQGFDSANPEHGTAAFGRRFCWAVKGQGSGDIQLAGLANQHEPNAPLSPPNGIRFNYSGWDQSDTSLLVSPPMKGLARYQNRLRLQVSFDDQNGGLLIGVLDNPQKLENTQIIDTLKPRGSELTNNWKTYTVTFNDPALVQQARHIVIANQKDHTRTFIDNIRYERIPDCQKPRNLKVANLGSDTATLKWTSPNDAGEWLITYGAPSFNPDKAGKTVSVNQSRATISGLSGNQPYEAYVQAVCKNGDTSYLSYPTTFKTYCQPFKTSYREGFDQVSLEYSDGFGDRRFCWSALGSDHQIRLYSNLPKYNPDTNNSVEISYSGGSDNPKPLLISPKFSDLSTLSNGVSLDVAFDDPENNKLYVGVINNRNNRSSFTILDTLEAKPNQKGNEFKRFYLPLDDGSVIKDQKHVAFTAKDNAVYYGFPDGVSIDNVVYETLPFCRTPTQFKVEDVDGTSATLSWKGRDKGQKWLIKVDTPGFDPHKSGKAYTFTNTVTDLKPDTRYQAFVRKICSKSDSSLYTKAISFRTDCQTPPAPLPYREGFDSFSGTYLEEARFCKGPAQWQFSSNNKDGRLRFSYSSAKDKQGRKSATLDSRSGHSPAVNFLTLNLNMAKYSTSKPYLLEFDYRSYKGRDRINDKVWIRGSEDDSWISIYNLNNRKNTYQQIGPINLSWHLRQNGQAFTENFQVRFGQEGNSYPGYDPPAGRSFDNISITRQDLAIQAMVQPEQACGLSGNEQLSLIVENTGFESIPANTLLTFQYTLNGQTPSPEFVSTSKPMAPNDTLRITFPSSQDMKSADTSYHMKAWLSWSGDQYQANDTMTKVMEVPDPQLTADHILDTSAMLKWNNTPNATQTRIISGRKGFDPAKSSETAETSNTQHHLGGLKPGVAYEVYTQEVCRNNDTGMLRGPLQFKPRTNARDIRTLSVKGPGNDCSSIADKPITVRFMNHGYDSIPAGTNLQLKYQLNGEAPAEKQVQVEQKLGPTDTANLLLEANEPFIRGRKNQVKVEVLWSRDQQPANNRVARSFYISERPDKPGVSNMAICRGELAKLRANSQAKYTDWYKTSKNEPLAKATDTLAVSPKENQTYYLQAYNHPDSCKSPAASVKVRVNNNPEVDFSPDTVCAKAPLTLSGRASVNQGTISHFTWKPEKLNTRNGKETTVKFPSAGIYEVRFQATSTKGCQASTLEFIQVTPAFNPAFSITRINEKSFKFRGPAMADSFRWNFGDGITGRGESVRHTFNQPGTYQVQLQSTKGTNCRLKDKETITIQPSEDEQKLNLYPNPASPSQPINLTYTLPSKQDVQLQLITLDGQEQYRQTLAKQPEGKHTAELAMPGQPGIYILKIRIGDQSYKKRLVLMP